MHPFGDVAFEPEVLARAAKSVADTGLLVVGEPHGARETPSVLYALASVLGTRAVAFEWSHEEMDDPLQSFVRSGSFDFERLWSLPGSAEFFCGDGRITAGHFALLQRLHREARLDQVIAFDRLDPVPPPDDWRVRDREMADRLLATWDRGSPLLALTGAFHARLDAAEGETMSVHLARELPGLDAAMLDYGCGAMPAASIVLRLGHATPAIVPGPARPAP